MKFDGPDYESLVLLIKNGETYKPYLDINQEEILLKDNGQSSDTMGNDGRFSVNAKISAQEVGLVELVVGVQEDNEWKIASKQAIIHVNTGITKEEAEQITAVNKDLTDLVSSLQDKKNSEEIKEEIIKKLESKFGVTDSGKTETAVWYVLESGVLGATTIAVEPANTLSAFSAATFSSTTATKEKSTATETTVGNRRVIIYSAHNQSESYDLITKLEESSIAFNIDKYTNEDATVDSFKEMFKYGTIIFDSKGASLFGSDLTEENPELDEVFNSTDELVIILTGEEATVEKNELYSSDLKTGRLAVVDGYYAITPAFVKFYGEINNFANSLVYANSSYSSNNESLANQFTTYGALAYIGHENEVTNGRLSSTFSELLDNKLLEDAIDINSGETVTGSKSVAYTKTSPLTNGMFNDTSGAGWISGGHFDIIDRLGANINKQWETILPMDGESMGIISSGLDDSVLNGRQSWVYQTFVVPEGFNTLKFNYNVVSNEPMEYIGSQFDDTFKATIVEGSVKEPQEVDGYDDEYQGTYEVPWLESTEDKNEKIIAYESVNSSDWGQVYQDDRQRVDAEFPTGDRTTYMTGWKTVAIDVSNYEGPITLKLQTWDLGDKIFPTAVLFDNVRLTKTEVDTTQIAGPSDVFIPVNDYTTYNEYQFNIVQVDNEGDTLTKGINYRLDNRNYRQPYEITQHGTFSLKENISGVSIDETTGIMSVSYDVDATAVTVIATLADGSTIEHTVNLINYSDMPFYE